VAAVQAAIAALAAQDRRVTLAAIEQASRGLPEGAISAKTVLRNPACRALYAAAIGAGTSRNSRSGARTLQAELVGAATLDDGAAPVDPSSTEVRRLQRLDRRRKQELAAMVIRLEREVEALQRHNANLRECLLRNGLGRSGQAEAEAVMVEPPMPKS
jgi:hypothetical protein